MVLDFSNASVLEVFEDDTLDHLTLLNVTTEESTRITRDTEETSSSTFTYNLGTLAANSQYQITVSLEGASTGNNQSLATTISSGDVSETSSSSITINEKDSGGCNLNQTSMSSNQARSPFSYCYSSLLLGFTALLLMRIRLRNR